MKIDLKKVPSGFRLKFYFSFSKSINEVLEGNNPESEKDVDLEKITEEIINIGLLILERLDRKGPKWHRKLANRNILDAEEHWSILGILEISYAGINKIPNNLAKSVASKAWLSIINKRENTVAAINLVVELEKEIKLNR